MRPFLIFLSLSFSNFLVAFDATIPVLHLPDYYHPEKKQEYLKKLDDAVKNVGFFALTGTGVNVEILDAAYHEAKEFFSLDYEQKIELKGPDGQRGYVHGESAKGENIRDFKEFYLVGREDNPELVYAENIWPKGPSNFKQSMLALYKALDYCKEAIGSSLEEVLQLEPNTLNDMTIEGDNLMRVIHYPANPPKDAIWAGAHTDIDLFTILPRSTARGLQVLNKNQEWVDVIVPDDAFVINCGDFLENLSNGYCRSSFHRVVDPGLDQERFSIVHFIHTRSDDCLGPLPHLIEKTGEKARYADVTRLELLAERLIDLGLASEELMHFFVNSGAIEKLKAVNRFSKKAEAALIAKGFL